MMYSALSWFAIPLEGIEMRRVNGYFLYVIGNLTRIHEIKEGDLVDRHHQMLSDLAQILAYWFLMLPQNRIELPAATSAAENLKVNLESFLKHLKLGKQFSKTDIGVLKNLLGRFEILLQEELGRAPVYVSEKKGIYDINLLLETANENLSPLAQKNISENVKRDYQAAGRCLAFEIYTGCGFHALRAVEDTARKYYKEMTGKAFGQGPLGNLIDKLQKNTKSSDDSFNLIIITLTRIKEIYRNPIMHPQLTLSKDEAMEVFALTANVISAIERDLETR